MWVSEDQDWVPPNHNSGLLRWFSAKESACQCWRRVRSLGQEDPLEQEVATHSSVLAQSLEGSSPWDREEPDTTEHTHTLEPHSVVRLWEFNTIIEQYQRFASCPKNAPYKCFLLPNPHQVTGHDRI